MNQRIEVAIIGNPNVGKTSIFNSLSGLNQKVGNWPGVTVEKKEGSLLYQNHQIHLIDLPGIYDFNSVSLDEKVAEDYLLRQTPDLVLYVADSTKLSRSLFLAVEILEMNIPMIFCLNMSDIASQKGIMIQEKKLSDLLGKTPVFSTNARSNNGIEEIKEAFLNIITQKTEPVLVHYEENEKTKLEKAIHTICEILPSSIAQGKKRYYSIKILENDNFLSKIDLDPRIKDHLQKIRSETQKNLERDLQDFITEKRYAFASGISREVSRNKLPLEKKLDLSDKIDRIMTNKYLGIPIFLGVMWLIFQSVFQIGNPIADILDSLKNSLSGWFGSVLPKNLLTSFITQGLIEGVGSIVVLLPNILIMFFFMAILEDSGYMARAAFIMDSFMHRFGLHGKSFIPMILGFGCNVPAIMSARTIETNKDRIITILISPFISCSARLPVYVLFAGIFFKKHEGLVVFSLYILGILVAILSANLFKKLFFKEESLPLIIELPFYQFPSFKKLLFHMWERSGIYLKKAGTIILFGTVIIWFLGSMPFGVVYASEESWIAKIGHIISPIFAPAGFGFWQAGVALLFGIVAKETVVSTMATLFAVSGSLENTLPQFFSPLSAYAFLVMTLLYIPCLATIAAMKQEAGNKWTFLAMSYSLVIGWLFAVGIFQTGKLF